MDKRPEACIISSVVPGHLAAIMEAGRKFTGKEPLMVSAGIQTGLRFEVDDPFSLGADRIAEAAGAARLFGAPVVVIDMGTATTVNFIGRGNVFKGGAILPGIGLMLDALYRQTARLPDVRPQKPASPLGKSTEASMLSGVILGSVGAVEKIISVVQKYEARRYKAVLTGGYSEIARPLFKRLDFIEPDLTLKGMRVIYGMNK